MRRELQACDEGDQPVPCWTVKTTYRRQQQFPPGIPVAIRIRYASSRGYERFSGGSILKNSCADERTITTVRSKAPSDGGDAVWHELPLASVAKRQGKIPEFELTVERPEGVLTSFCWPGPVEKRAKGVFQARVRDFVPNDKLIAAFFGPWTLLE